MSSGRAPEAPLLLVLDVDDTLYLEREYVRSGFQAVGRHVRERLGADGFAERAWAAFEAGIRGDTFDRVLRALGIEPEPERVADLVRVYRTHRPRISLLPDAEAFLLRWHGRAALAAITDGPRDSQARKVEALGLSRWIDPVVLTADLGPGMGKPHPRAFEAVMERAGASPSRCVYLADNPLKDFRAPRALGWRTVRVRRPLGLHAALPSGEDVDAEVTDLQAADAFLEGI